MLTDPIIDFDSKRGDDFLSSCSRLSMYNDGNVKQETIPSYRTITQHVCDIQYLHRQVVI